MQPEYNFNIPEELFKTIEDEFGGAKIAQKYLDSKDTTVFDEWGNKKFEPQAGIAIYEIGETGKIAAVRI